jgi:hypothetical protein
VSSVESQFLDSVGLRLQIRKYSISQRRVIFTYDLVVIPWLIREIGQREGGFDLWEVGLGLLFPRLADRLCGVGGPSARSSAAGRSLCSSHVLESLCFDLSCRWFLVGRSWSDSPPRVAGQSVQLGLSAVLAGTVRFQGVVLEVLLAFSDCPPLTHGPSVRLTWTVRPVTTDCPL